MEEETEVELLHFKLRLTPEMHEKLKILAVQNKRTMSAEIVARLEGSFESPPALPPALLERLRKRAGVRNRPAGKFLIDIVEDAVGMMEFQDEAQYREAEANLDELSDDEFRSVMNTITIIRDKRGNADKTIKKTNSSNKAKKQT